MFDDTQLILAILAVLTAWGGIIGYMWVSHAKMQQILATEQMRQARYRANDSPGQDDQDWIQQLITFATSEQGQQVIGMLAEKFKK